MAKNRTPEEVERRKLNIVRFGLMVIPPIAFALSFSLPFVLYRAVGEDWVGKALVPSLIQTAVVAVVCVIVWFIYKRAVTRA